MIFLMTAQKKLAQELKKKLEGSEQEIDLFLPKDPKSLSTLYSQLINYEAVITESSHPLLPDEAWLDLLNNLGRKVLVIIISFDKHHIIDNPNTELINWIFNPSPNEVYSLVKKHIRNVNVNNIESTNFIPLYNKNFAEYMLHNYGTLSILNIQGSGLKNIAIGYGSESYEIIKNCFENCLLKLWRSSPELSSEDILCKASTVGNEYYLLMGKDLGERKLIIPGKMEELSKKILKKFQELLWQEILDIKKEHKIPEYLSLIHHFSIGHGTVLFNPCVHSAETVLELLNVSKASSQAQRISIQSWQKSLIEILIKKENLLKPNYQGVFKLKDLTEKDIQESLENNSLKPIANSIFGFESLIRINFHLLEDLLGKDTPMYMSQQSLNPETLFSMAKITKLSLELDQACINLSSKYFNDIPGYLMANILPRNLYYIDKIKKNIGKGETVILEISESEAINNIELILEIKKSIAKNKFQIAIDDFGKGYAGMDRIIQIKPDIIKLDRCLIQNIHQDEPKRELVSGLVKAAQITKSLIIAEGIELLEELLVIKKLGVHLAQGYLLHRPQEPKEIVKDLKEKNKYKIKVAS